MRQPLLITAAALALIVVAFYTYVFLSSSQESPEVLTERALTAADVAQQEAAALKLAGYGEVARPHLRRLLAESQTPAVQAAAVDGLGGLRDWPSMPGLIEALDSADLNVRARAGVAVARILGADFRFDAQAPPPQRAAIIQRIEAEYNLMKTQPPPEYAALTTAASG